MGSPGAIWCARSVAPLLTVVRLSSRHPEDELHIPVILFFSNLGGWLTSMNEPLGRQALRLLPVLTIPLCQLASTCARCRSPDLMRAAVNQCGWAFQPIHRGTNIGGLCVERSRDRWGYGGRTSLIGTMGQNSELGIRPGHA